MPRRTSTGWSRRFPNFSRRRSLFRRFMEDNRSNRGVHALFGKYVPGMARPLFAAHAEAASLLRPWLSLDQELARYFGDPRIRLAFSFQSKYLGMSPYRCPSLFSILSFLEYEHGVYHPIGGCGAVTDAMARIAREMGVEIHLGEEAKEILFEGRRAVGVRTAGGTYSADALVVNADFARAMTRLVPDNLRRRWKNQRIAASNSRARPLCSTWASKGATTTLATTRSIWMKNTLGTCMRSRNCTSYRNAVILRTERLYHRPVARPARHEHPLRPGAGDTPASQR